MSKTPVTQVKIGGMWHSITKVFDSRLVPHNSGAPELWGQIDYAAQSIRIKSATPERERRLLLHEILHGIIESYAIRELVGPNDDHTETAIDQLSFGLAEALESMGWNPKL